MEITVIVCLYIPSMITFFTMRSMVIGIEKQILTGSNPIKSENAIEMRSYNRMNETSTQESRESKSGYNTFDK